MEFHESPKLTGMAEIAEIGMKTTVRGLHRRGGRSAVKNGRAIKKSALGCKGNDKHCDTTHFFCVALWNDFQMLKAPAESSVFWNKTGQPMGNVVT